MPAAKKVSKNISLEVEPDEVRFIAVLRAIKDFATPELISKEDSGNALALLQAVHPNLEEIEKENAGPALKLFLLGFVSGLGAARVQATPYDSE